MLKRYLIFFLGLAILALGVAFSIKADLGTSPISSLPYIDMALKVIESIAVVHYGSAVAYCLLGILLVGVGVWLEGMANVVMQAGEGVVLAFSKVVPVKFGYLKIGWSNRRLSTRMETMMRHCKPRSRWIGMIASKYPSASTIGARCPS